MRPKSVSGKELLSSFHGRIHSVSWGASLLGRCTLPVRETL
jgi:hypothetical protein